jgi:histone H4
VVAPSAGEPEPEPEAESEEEREPEPEPDLDAEEKARLKMEKDANRRRARETRLASLKGELERLIHEAAVSGRRRLRHEEEQKRTNDYRSTHRKHIEEVGPPDCFGRTAMRRIARRAGCKRISTGSFAPLQEAAVNFMEDIIRDCIEYTERFTRRTITLEDVCTHLKRHGHTLYGFW